MRKIEAEGGCGVIGVAAAEKIAGRHLLPPLDQMCNRGNNKGGGIAAAGLRAEAFNISQEILENDYLFAVAYLQKGCIKEVEEKLIFPFFTLDHTYEMPTLPNYKELPDLEIEPPHVKIYFGRVKKELCQNCSEDQKVYEQAHLLNSLYYDPAGEKQAFVLSHGKNLLVLKLVGFGNNAIRYYKLEDFYAHVWIGHHRYPTKGRVWHPGGAHPFVGQNEALVHNGDFANYYSLCEYLAARNICPQFLTDTEVAVLLFDLLHRSYEYPLEYVIEALAPTTERDFTMLSDEKKALYDMIQKTHMHGSPDGPWFFLIAQSLPKTYRLIGITDTSMLRPQVFALQTGRVPIGFAASEKQAIDACLKSLSKEDARFWEVADHYWNARGGSFTDGGAFSFTVEALDSVKGKLICSDKFGNTVHMEKLNPSFVRGETVPNIGELPESELFEWTTQRLLEWGYEKVLAFLERLKKENTDLVLKLLTHLIDRRYSTGKLRQSSLRALFQNTLDACLRNPNSDKFILLRKGEIKPTPQNSEQTLIIDAKGYAAEGYSSLALELVNMYRLGFKKFILFNLSGQRFIGNGFGPDSGGVRIDVFGSSGDYLASGIDGAEIYVHGTAQDQLAQIMNGGKLVVYGDLGQAFMYGAKGGKAFVLGNTAGRPLINAVGNPKVVINGTCLDYLAESFMAGHPFRGGGFVVLNALRFDELRQDWVDLEIPYPGSNLFSLASGGALYIRDPAQKLTSALLNGAEFAEMLEKDWELILPYLEENADIFDIPVTRLLEFEGKRYSFEKIYRKVQPVHTHILQGEEAWVRGV